MMTGRIVSIQRSSYHDGPGLRTTVFFKGCQLRCPWCHNPESISMDVETLSYPEKCIGCGKCGEGCYTGARETVGRDVTVEDVLTEIMEDAPFYWEDGGVTLSGGEPLLQRAFALELIEKCHARGIKVAVESNLCFPEDVARPVLEKIDLLMGDVKLIDSKRHKEVTGMGNERALENFRLASHLKKPIILRTPVIPGINATPGEIAAIANFALELGTLLYYELLAYHPLGADKAKAMGIGQRRFETPDKELLEELRAAALSKLKRVMVNGREGALT